MKTYRKAIICIAATILLALIVVYLFIPNYDTPEAREALLKQQDSTYEILREETFGDYVICISKNDKYEGYHLFKNTLGKLRFDHARHSNTGCTKGYLEQDGQTYLIHANFLENAKSFDIVYYDLSSNEEIHRDRVSLDGQLTIVPLLFKDGIGNTLILYDAEGNQI